MAATTNPLGRFTRWLERRLWSLRIAWRTVTGRLFIFRDAPDHIVMECAMTDPLKRSNPELAARWQRDAEDEMTLRLRRLEREIKAEIQKAQPPQP